MINTLWYPAAKEALKRQGYEDAGDGRRFIHRRHGHRIVLGDHEDLDSLFGKLKESVADVLISSVLFETTTRP
jgi:hypothetical protein